MPPPQIDASQRQNYSVQFLTAPTADTSGTSFSVTFDKKRYIFGQLAEGTQRAIIQRGFGLRKVTDLFLTGTTTWKTNGGLLGMILSIADVLNESDDTGRRTRIHIHGAPKLLHTVATARRFIFRTSMPLTIHEANTRSRSWPTEPSFVDESLRVWSVPIKDAGSEAAGEDAARVDEEQAARQKIVKDMFDSDWRRDRLIEKAFKDVDLPAMVFIRGTEEKGLVGVHCPTRESASHIAPDQKVFVRNPWPASLIGTLPPADNLPSNVSVAYVIKGHPQRGTFDRQKAIALGVKPGPAYSLLAAGESVTLENGDVITSDMVVGPTRVGQGVAVFDLPSPGHAAYLDQALKSAPEDALTDVVAGIWILGHQVGASEEFRALLRRLVTLKHFISDPDQAANKLAYEDAALSTLRLAKINPKNFSVPIYDHSHPYGVACSSGLTTDYGVETTTVQHGLKVQIEPKFAVDESVVPPASELGLLDDLELPDSIIETKAPPEASSGWSKTLDEPEIITLGTGSSHPSKYRNVSATLVRMPAEQGNVLLDCGENTVGQLKRTFPHAQYLDVLRRTQALWISHLHADHHLGTVSFLQERAQAFDALGEAGRDIDRTIYLISESNMIDFMSEYASVEPTILTRTGYMPIVCRAGQGLSIFGQPFDIASSNTAIQKVESVKVSHCAHAQAVSITFNNGFKVSYSGDCRPSSNFCKVGVDSDVLIHEATFEDDMRGDAVAKKHSTTSEALGVAVDMRAKNVVLTHFSQRYPKVPNISSVKKKGSIEYEEANAEQDSEPVEANGPPPSTTPADTSTDSITPLKEKPQPSDITLDPLNVSGLSPTKPHFFDSDAIPDIPICVAFDCMRIKVSEIAEAKKYYPAIQQLFDLQEQASDRKRAAAREVHERFHKVKAAKRGQAKNNGGDGAGGGGVAIAASGDLKDETKAVAGGISKRQAKRQLRKAERRELTDEGGSRRESVDGENVDEEGSSPPKKRKSG